MTDLEQFFLTHKVPEIKKEFAEKVFNENIFVEKAVKENTSDVKYLFLHHIKLDIHQRFEKAPNKIGSKKFIQRFHKSFFTFNVDGIHIAYMLMFRANNHDYATSDFVLIPFKSERGLLYFLFRSSGHFHESYNIVIHSHVFDRMVNRGPYLNRTNAIQSFLLALIKMQIFPKKFQKGQSFENDTVVVGLNGDAILGNVVNGVNYLKTFITQDMFGSYQKEDYVSVVEVNKSFEESFDKVEKHIRHGLKDDQIHSNMVV